MRITTNNPTSLSLHGTDQEVANFLRTGESNWVSPSQPTGNINESRIIHGIAPGWPLDCTVDVAHPDRDIVTIQNQIRAIIARHIPLGLKFLGISPDMCFKPFIHRQKLDVIVALGGLSECGKSTIGGAIERMYGQRGRREKIG